jgi:hypothetical protein
MFIGCKYVLAKPTVALDFIDLRWTVLTIPVGAVIEVLSEPESQKKGCQVKVRWRDRTVNMFAVDIEARGEILPV